MFWLQVCLWESRWEADVAFLASMQDIYSAPAQYVSGHVLSESNFHKLHLGSVYCTTKRLLTYRRFDS
jgi:hypothetical protein